MRNFHVLKSFHANGCGHQRGIRRQIVIITAAVAIVRLTGEPRAARAAFDAHLASVLARVGLDPAPAPPGHGSQG